MNPEELRLLEEANRARLLAAQQAAQGKKPAATPNAFDAALAYDPNKLQGLMDRNSQNMINQAKVLHSLGTINPLTGTKSAVRHNMDGSIEDPLAPKGMAWIEAYGPNRPEVAQRKAALDGGTMAAAMAGGNAVAALKAQQIANGTRGPADDGPAPSNFGQVSTNQNTGERIAYDKQGNQVGSSTPNKQPVSPWGPSAPAQAPVNQPVVQPPVQAPQPIAPSSPVANVVAAQPPIAEPSVASLIYRQPEQPPVSWDRPYAPGVSEPMFTPSDIPQPGPSFNPTSPPGVNRGLSAPGLNDYLNLARSAFGMELPTVPMFPPNNAASPQAPTARYAAANPRKPKGPQKPQRTPVSAYGN